MSEPRARIAFIGCGRHATRSLYPCIAEIPEIDLVATCDAQEELAQRNARNFGARHWYTSVDRLLEQEAELDGAIVVGPPMMMHDLAHRLFRTRRIPVFLEKPPAITAAQARALAATAAEAGTWGQVGFMKRFALGYQLAKRAADEPDFGAVSVFDAKFTNGAWGPLWGVFGPGDGFLAVQAIHIFDLAHFFMGPTAEVYAGFLQRSEAVHGFAITLTFASGSLGSLNLNSFETWEGIDESLSLSGEGAFVTVDDMLSVKLHRRQGWGQVCDPLLANFDYGWSPQGPIAPDLRLILGYRAELQEFARCILEGRRPGPDLEAGAAALHVGEAAWQSVQTGLPVRI